jgi:hypothetical protein
MIYDFTIGPLDDEGNNFLFFREKTPTWEPKVTLIQYNKQDTKLKMTAKLWVEGRHSFTEIKGLSDADLKTIANGIINYLKEKENAQKKDK